MSKLLLPTYKIGMTVVAPSSNIPHITEDKKYVILDIQDDWLQVQDDSGYNRYHQSFLFIDPDVYYNMMIYLTIIRIFDLNPYN